MLKILECNPSGCFSYGLHPTLRFGDTEVVELTGWNYDRLTQTANGSGKSSLLNTVCHLLYGEDPSGAADTEVPNSVWNKGCFGYIKFNAPNGSLYRVMMVRKWTQDPPDAAITADPSEILARGDEYKGTDIFFEEWTGSTWADRRKTKMTETRAIILRTVGISYEQFLTTSYLAQQKTSRFVTGKNKDRMSIVSEMMDLSIWDKARAVASKRVSVTTTALLAAESTLEGHRQALGTIPHIMNDDEIYELHTKIHSLGLRIDAANSNSVTLRTAAENCSNDLVELNKLNHTLTLEYNTAVSNEEAQRKKISELNHKCELEQANAKIDSTEAPHQALRIAKEAEIAVFNRQLASLMTGGGTCQKCGTLVDEKHLAAHRATLNESIKAAQQAVAEANKLILKARAFDAEVLKGLRDDIKKSYAAKLVTQNEERERLGKLTKAARDKLDDNKAKIDTMRDTLTDINLSLRDQTQMIESSNAEIRLLNERLSNESAIQAQIVNVTKLIEAGEEKRDKLRADIAALQAVVKGMSDKGIKAHKFASVIEVLNKLVAEYIDIVAEGQVQVWFSPWKESARSKGEDDYIAEIQIFVREGPKEAVELNLYSGAERQQITLAIICAFWRLAVMNGMGTNLLFLDEIFGMFDGPTASLAVKLLVHLRDAHQGCIVVVTHDEKIKNMLPFDRSWVCEKKQHISTIKEAENDL